MSTLSCPRCSTPLTTLTIEGQAALACPGNHGVWLDHAQLDAIVEDATDDATDAEEARAWRASDPDPLALSTEQFWTCPACSRTLKKDIWKYGSGVVVDTCPEHGVWVEPGELERLEAWSEAWSSFVASESPS